MGDRSKTNYTCTEEHFRKDTEAHQLTICLDAGNHRHLRFRSPKSFAYWFDIVTWPGYLCISGDMGHYVFTRIDDMFAFFRPSDASEALFINPSYWAEKLRADDCHGEHGGDSVKAFSAALFRDNVKRWLGSYLKDARLSISEKKELRDQVSRELIEPDWGRDDERIAITAALDFKFRGNYVFQDFYECNNREYTLHFIWCLYAIVWGIACYDAEKLAAFFVNAAKARGEIAWGAGQ